MRLSQAPPNLLKAVILAELVIIILVLLMLLQFSSYYAKATALEQQQQHQQLSLSPSPSHSSSSSTITKDTPPQKENKSIMMMTKLLAKSKTDIGAWDPYQMPLEELQGSKQEKAIKSLLEQGFSEY